MNLLAQYDQKTMTKALGNKSIPEFRAGDTLKVAIRISEGANERTQVFEGVCIARKNRGVGSSFTVRKVSHNQGVERIFHLYSPKVEGIEVVKRGVVRRAKLYYMRDLRGKAARIKEKVVFAKPSAQQ